MTEQSWKRPWTTEEIIKNADKWTLAGDAALLNTIKHFGENLLSTSEKVSNSIDKLLLSADELKVKLNIAQNEFQSLKNSQFIENRVQEEDETLENTEEKMVLPEPMTAEGQSKMITNVILSGIKIMEKYYDNVEVSISDSEDEAERSYVLKPKDLYAHRPLPPLIGSEDWHKKWYLEDASSESDSEKISETYSDSESEEDLPKDLNKISGSSSELDFSSVTSESRPIGSSTFNDSTKKTDFIPSSEESDGNLESHVAKTPVTNKSFAEQLSAKLGTVISVLENPPLEEVNTRPIQPVKNNNYTSPLFSDVPPPLDDFQDKSSVSNMHSDLFSGGEGLFDDSEDDFWEPKKSDSKRIQGKDEKLPDIKTSLSPAPIAKNIFDGEDDEDIFQKSSRKPQQINVAGLLPKDEPKRDINDNKQAVKIGKGLFDDDNEENLFSNIPQKPSEIADSLFKNSPSTDETESITANNRKIKPVGGVSVFASADLFGNQNIKDILENRQKQTKPKSLEKPAIAENKPKTSENTKGNEISISSNKKPEILPKKPNLPVEKPILFNNNSDNVDAASLLKPTTSKLFESDKIGNEFPAEPTPSGKVKSVNLFDEDDDEDFFAGISRNVSKVAVVSKIENLQDTSKDNTKQHDIFDDLFTDTSSNAVSSTLKKKPNLFDDDDDLAKYDLFADIPDDDVDDLFSTTSKILDKSKKLISETIKKDKEDTSGINKSDDKKDFNYMAQSVEFESSTSTETRNVDGINGGDITADIPESSDNLGDNTIKAENFEDDIMTIKHKESTDQIEDLYVSKVEEQTEFTNKKTEEFKALDHKEFENIREYEDGSTKVKPNESISRIGGIYESKAIDQNKSISIIGDEDESNKELMQEFDNVINEEIAYGRVQIEPQADHKPYEVVPKDATITTEKGISDDIFSQNITKPSDFLGGLAEQNIFETDFTTDNVKPFLDKSEKQSFPKAEPNSFVGLFDSSPPTDDEADWDTKSDNFSDSDDLASYPVVKDEKRSVFDNEPPSLEPPPLDEHTDSVQINDPISKREPDATPSVMVFKDTKDYGMVKNVEATSNSSTLPSATKETGVKISGTINKLKNNLNINVNALRPGFAPPKFKDTPLASKATHPTDTVDDNSVPKNLPTSTTSLPIQMSKNSERGVNFEAALDQHEVLHSYTKTRAKIPLKRKPSTRRGRQEALKRSATDNLSDKEDTLEHNPLQRSVSEGAEFSKDSTLPKPKIMTQSVLKSTNEINNQMLQYNTKSQEDTDLKNETGNLIRAQSDKNKFLSETDQTEKKEKLQDSLLPREPMKSSEVKTSSDNIFEESGKDDDNLFSTNLSKKLNVKPKPALFESSDSEEDLFGKNDTRKDKARTKNVKIASEKGLFDDTSSEDDLFASSKK